MRLEIRYDDSLIGLTIPPAGISIALQKSRKALNDLTVLGTEVPRLRGCPRSRDRGKLRHYEDTRPAVLGEGLDIADPLELTNR
jgi:hypothetical protein